MVLKNTPRIDDAELQPGVVSQVDPTMQPHPLHDTGKHKSAISRRIGKNVSVTILVQIANMLSRLLSVSFMLSHLGVAMYGTWQIIFIPVSLMGTTTMGVSNVYVKYVAEYTARKEYDRANALLSTGLTFTIPFCIGLFAGMYFLWDWLALRFKLPPAYAHETREAALIVFAIFLANIALSAYTDVISGVQEIAAAQWIQLSAYVVEIVLIFTLVAMGRGILGMAEAYLAGTLIWIGISIIWCYRNLKWLRVSPRRFSAQELHHVFGFGLIAQVQCIFDILLSNIDRIVGGWFLGPLAVTPIDLAKKMPSALSNIPGAFFTAFIPAASQLQAEHDSRVAADGHAAHKESPIAALYIEGSRYTNIVSGYFFGLMAMLPVAIFSVWLAKPVAYVIPLFVLFNLAMQMHMLTGPGTSILRGAGRVHEEFYYSIPNALCICMLVPISYRVIHGWSVLGIGAAVCLSTFLSAIFFLIRVHFVMRVPWIPYLLDVILPGIVPYFVAVFLIWPVTRLVLSVGRIEGAGVLFVTGLLYTLILAIVLDTMVLSKNERERWRSLLKRFRSTRQHAV
jgi:O-antigen/teichoic acid export membrane protein